MQASFSERSSSARTVCSEPEPIALSIPIVEPPRPAHAVDNIPTVSPTIIPLRMSLRISVPSRLVLTREELAAVVGHQVEQIVLVGRELIFRVRAVETVV